MNRPPSGLSFQRFDAVGGRAQRDTVELIYCDAYVDFVASGDPFRSVETFMSRFDAYTSRDGFDQVIAYLDGEPVGQSWGWALRPNSAWWHGLLAEPEPGFTVEDGIRTFALSELMVRQRWTGQGIAYALHAELLRERRETRATLLVLPDNTTAHQIYTRWGWCKVAQLRPDWPDAPLFDVLILPLR
ncbi:MAG: GNAT family N-acetyltransferase [Pseudonocardiaceae bacterium]